MVLVHVSSAPRNDGSQRCSRCGAELSGVDSDPWPADCLIEVATDDEGVVLRTMLDRLPSDEAMCLAPADESIATDANGTVG